MNEKKALSDIDRRLIKDGNYALVLIATITAFAAFILSESIMYREFSLALDAWQNLSVADGKDPIEIARVSVSQFKTMYPEICTNRDLAKHCLRIEKNLNSAFIQYKVHLSTLLMIMAGFIGFKCRKEIVFFYKRVV